MQNWIVSLAALPLFAAAVLAADKPAVEGAAPGQWTMDFEAARKVATEKKLPLLLNFTGSDWCGWCKHMDKTVFSQEVWNAYAKQNLMLVWIDFPQDKSLVPEKYVARNKALSTLFGIEGYPAYIILDDDGKNQLGQLGADREITPDAFIAKIKAILKNRRSEVEALLKAMPEKSAQEFRATTQKLEASRSELKALEDSYEKKRVELKLLIDEAQKRLDALRAEASLAKLPKEKIDAYRAKKTRYDALSAELKAWLTNEPPNNEANMKKFRAWRDEIAGLEKEIQSLLETK